MGARFKKLADDAKSRIREVSAKQASEEQSKGAVLIDVRENDEFALHDAKNAIHLSKGVIELGIEDAVPHTSTPIVWSCGGVSRSALAPDNPQKKEYANV